MSAPLTRFIVMALAVCVPLAARPEPLPRKESNVSIRNEVQLAIDKGLAHLQRTQGADGTWGKVGTTGFVLIAFGSDPRGGDKPSTKEGRFTKTLQKAYVGLRAAFREKGDLREMDEFAWNMPPALIALQRSGDPGDHELVERARRAVGDAPLPEAPETRTLFLWVDPKNRPAGEMPAHATGSALAAWHSLVKSRETGYKSEFRNFGDDPVSRWFQVHYTLERNPEGEGVHRYYLWLTSGFPPGLTSPEGDRVDIPRQVAEKLINEQNGNGSWSGVGEHWTEKDPNLVTAMCVLTLEQVYSQL
jgi:hypothetical protein